MSAMQQSTPNHQSETFASGQTQFFDCEALSADHPEIQARERARQQRFHLSKLDFTHLFFPYDCEAALPSHLSG
jgi:hypothetical protein